MKFEYVNVVDEPVLSYGYLVKTGDVVDLPEHFTRKAMANKHWKQVDSKSKVTVTEPYSDPDADDMRKELEDLKAKLARSEARVVELETELDQRENTEPSKRKPRKKKKGVNK